MQNLINISEAASLALHTTVLLAHSDGEAMPTNRIAAKLRVSEAHLAKVMQRLGKAGVVHGQRGPGGGFTLARDPEQITLLDVLEGAEGAISIHDCLYSQPICQGDCLMGGLLSKVGHQVLDYFKNTRLSDLGHVYREDRNEEAT